MESALLNLIVSFYEQFYRHTSLYLHLSFDRRRERKPASALDEVSDRYSLAAPLQSMARTVMIELQRRLLLHLRSL